MRLIDSDALERDMQNEWEQNEISNGEWIRFREILNDVPTIDAVEVVRCKDCRHWHDEGYCNKWDNGPGHPEVWENDFCSFGERREE